MIREAAAGGLLWAAVHVKGFRAGALKTQVAGRGAVLGAVGEQTLVEEELMAIAGEAAPARVIAGGAQQLPVGTHTGLPTQDRAAKKVKGLFGTG